MRPPIRSVWICNPFLPDAATDAEPELQSRPEGRLSCSWDIGVSCSLKALALELAEC